MYRIAVQIAAATKKIPDESKARSDASKKANRCARKATVGLERKDINTNAILQMRCVDSPMKERKIVIVPMKASRLEALENLPR